MGESSDESVSSNISFCFLCKRAWFGGGRAVTLVDGTAVGNGDGDGTDDNTDDGCDWEWDGSGEGDGSVGGEMIFLGRPTARPRLASPPSFADEMRTVVRRYVVGVKKKVED
jgi:hypothetical protein